MDGRFASAFGLGEALVRSLVAEVSQNQLELSGDQIKQLTAIQEKSNTDAKAVLTDEQRTKLGTVTKGWKTMSMDQCWTLMNQ